MREKPKAKKNVSVDQKKGKAKMKPKPKKCSKKKVMRRTSIGSKCAKKSARCTPSPSSWSVMLDKELIYLT